MLFYMFYVNLICYFTYFMLILLSTHNLFRFETSRKYNTRKENPTLLQVKSSCYINIMALLKLYVG